ncbi:MAG: GTP 3',8-cyclase MoaA, partial [Magnetococcales bacterium]|nr:GTP 3',8-cyclase MoaA [Magnetococcales bacterium]
VGGMGGVNVGIISALSQHFCATCNRMRLTSRGQLVLCLGQADRSDLRTPLRAGADDDRLRQQILEAVQAKPEGHAFNQPGIRTVPHRMVTLGG